MSGISPALESLRHGRKEPRADIAAVFELAPPPPQAVLIAEDPFGPNATVEALYQEPPDADLLSTLVGQTVSVEPLPDQDWIRQSQLGLPPVRAGRFFVYGAHDSGAIPARRHSDPHRSRARLRHRPSRDDHAVPRSDHACRPAAASQRILDLGCGTGVLAIAAAKLWRRPVLASDIDPVAIDVARDNARMNGAGAARPRRGGRRPEQSRDPAHAPYDLILANILAGPLRQLAPALSGALARGGIAVLSGLLRDQEHQVSERYQGARAGARAALRKARGRRWSWNARAGNLAP